MKVSSLSQWAAAAWPCPLQRVSAQMADASGTVRASAAVTPPKVGSPALLELSQRLVRSKIGCVACALLMLACAVDHGSGTLDFLDWPGVTAAVLLVTGLPHGALDIELLRAASGGSSRFFVTRSLLEYVAIALSVLAFWWVLPAGALVLLLLLSAHHFGGDWAGLGKTAERLIVGACVLSAPALNHEASVALIFSWLVAGNPAFALSHVMHLVSLPLLVCVAILVFVRWHDNRAQCEEIVVVCFAAAMLPPLTFFMIYFGALHSMRHLVDVRQTLSNQSTRALIARGAPYAVTALACCGVGAVWFPHLPPGAAFLSAVFVGLAALTVPHMLLGQFSNTTLEHVIRRSA